MQQLVFYSKLIILKDISKYKGKREPKDILIPFEKDHKQNDKTYKLVQYRSLSENVHQLIFINLKLQSIWDCINCKSENNLAFKFIFNFSEILIAKEIHLKDIYRPNNFYLYKISNFIALHNNKNKLLNTINTNFINEEVKKSVESKLLDHIKRLITLIGIQNNLNLIIDVFPLSFELPKSVDLNKYSPYMFTFIFQSNAFLPDDFNLGKHISMGNGILEILNIDKYDNKR